MSPLKPIHRAKITLLSVSQTPLLEEIFASVSVPYFDALLRKHSGIRAALNKPEKFFYNGT
jgi:hypothetical protein